MKAETGRAVGTGESGRWLPGKGGDGLGRGERGVLLNGHSVLLLGDTNALESESGDGCVQLYTY